MRSIFSSAIVTMFLATSPLARQSATPSAPVKATLADQSNAAGRMSGIWHLNTDLSTGSPTQSGASGADPGRPGGPPGGGGGFGGGGGRGGGRGGGGGFGGGAPGGVSSEDTLKMRALLREASAPPADMTIVARATSLQIAQPDGVVRLFNINAKKEKLDLTTAKIDVRTRWNGVAIEQDLTGAQVKMKRTFQLTEDGKQLIVTVENASSSSSSASRGRGPAGGGPSGSAIRSQRLVYERPAGTSQPQT